MNRILLAKLVWRVAVQGGETWVSVIRNKYGLSDEGLLHFKVKQRSSIIWKGITWGADLLCKGLKWEVKNDERVRFWLDKWIEDVPLASLCTRHL